MSYPTVEALWLARLQEMDDFDEANSGRATMSLLHTGNAAQYAILYPGRLEHGYLGMGGSRTHLYRTRIQLWKQLLTDGDTAQELETLADSVRREMDKYPLLGDTTGKVSQSRIAVTEAMQMNRLREGGPWWLMVELIGECHYEELVTFAE